MVVKKRTIIVFALLLLGLLYTSYEYVAEYIDSGYVQYSTTEYLAGGVKTIKVTNFQNDSEVCFTKGGSAGDGGYKAWCWSDLSLGEKPIKSRKSINKREIKVDYECNPNQVKIEGSQLKFHVSPLAKIPDSDCNRSYNMRAEIRTAPWKVNHPIGTEEWFGWTYTFDEDYKIDKENPWLFFQVHEGTVNQTPLLALWCMNNGGPGSGRAGEVHLVNNAYATKSFYHPSGFVPRAGETLEIVVHVVWGDFNKGLIQLWVNGDKVYDQQERTVRASNPVGGNAKWGIYKWKWAEKERIEKSIAQDIFSLNTSMGALRIITRKPEDPDYLKPSYSTVMP